MSDLMEYAGRYQAARKTRCQQLGGNVLPLEILRDKGTGILHLSVSFSGTGGETDAYITQRATLFRAVKIELKWWFIPSTVSRVLTREQLLASFGDLLETRPVDGEDFWVFRGQDAATVRDRIRTFELSNSFRDAYEHAYLPDSAQPAAKPCRVA